MGAAWDRSSNHASHLEASGSILQVENIFYLDDAEIYRWNYLDQWTEA